MRIRRTCSFIFFLEILGGGLVEGVFGGGRMVFMFCENGYFFLISIFDIGFLGDLVYFVVSS